MGKASEVKNVVVNLVKGRAEYKAAERAGDTRKMDEMMRRDLSKKW